MSLMAKTERLTIQETAEHTGLSAHTLRYYERIGLLVQIPRSASGYRLYGPENLVWVEFIICLRHTGMSIRNMRRFVELAHSGKRTLTDRITLLTEHRQVLVREMETLDRFLHLIDTKIAKYSEQAALRRGPTAKRRSALPRPRGI